MSNAAAKKSTKDKLRRKGFNRCSSTRNSMAIRVGCSQCQALVINGVACHETGCPRAGKKRN